MITFAADYGYAGVSPATAINYLLDLYTEHYQTLVGQMSEKQRGVFMAIATEKIQIGERALFHQPAAAALHHRHNNLFADAVAIGQDEEDVDSARERIALGIAHADTVYALMGMLLLCHKLLIAREQLLTIAGRQGVGPYPTLEKLLVLAARQMSVIAFRSQRCRLLGRHLATTDSQNSQPPSNKAQKPHCSQSPQQPHSPHCPTHFCLINTLMGEPVSVQFSRILFSRNRL